MLNRTALLCVHLHVRVLVLVCLVLVSGCTTVDGAPRLGSSSASGSPDAVPHHDRGAPEAFRERAELPSCGSYVLVHEPPPPEAVTCLVRAQGRPDGAELVLSRVTVEGDPVVGYYRALPGDRRVELFTDSTRDRYGSRAWTRVTCTGFDAANLSPTGCGEPEDLS